MPKGYNHNASLGVPQTINPNSFVGMNEATQIFERPYAITGTTKDSTGAALASCVVDLFRTADDTLATSITSDASGNYLVPASQYLTHYAVAYKAGSPDVAGTTVNTLAGA